jgi:hypothetical protein
VINRSQAVRYVGTVPLRERFPHLSEHRFEILRQKRWINDEIHRGDVLNKGLSEAIEEDSAGSVLDEIVNAVTLRFFSKERSASDLQPETLDE